MSRLLCASTLLLIASSPLSARDSIVGTWATPGGCGKPLSTIVIEPLAISGEDFFCRFTEVERRADTVAWSGRCTFGADDSKPSRVAARLEHKRLSYRIGKGGWNGPLQRCLAPVRFP